MSKYLSITEQNLTAFQYWLQKKERAVGTVESYMRHVGRLKRFLKGKTVSKERVNQWKNSLQQAGYQPVSINAMLAAANQFFIFKGWTGCRLQPLRLQKKIFRAKDRELSRAEYRRLVETAKERGKQRLALLIETICATGIRVSEVSYITVAAAREGKAEISLKGKFRTILLPGKLQRKLLQFAKKNQITAGAIFRTRNKTPLNRKQIWAEMKALCKAAKIAPSKVFPHNLRHLFARAFYKISRDVAKLADILGHSSIETTRIYLISTGEEHARQLERLQLVL